MSQYQVRQAMAFNNFPHKFTLEPETQFSSEQPAPSAPDGQARSGQVTALEDRKRGAEQTHRWEESGVGIQLSKRQGLGWVSHLTLMALEIQGSLT